MDGNKTDLDDPSRIPSRLISQEALTNFFLVEVSLWLIICPLGVWANAMVIRTFLRMGLNDSVSISFFSLGLSDFAHVFTPLISTVLQLLRFIENKFHFFLLVQTRLIATYVITFTSYFSALTMFITTFLALQRCLCIVKALYFKDMFTKKRTVCILGCFCLISAVNTIAYLSSYDNKKVTNPSTNTSQYILIMKPWYKHIEEYVGTPFNVMCPIVSQILVFGTVIVMSIALKASVKFRQEASAIDSASHENNVMDKSAHTYRENDKSGGQNSKERTALIQVVVLSIIFLVTNLPKVILAIAATAIPDLGFGQLYENMFMLLAGIRVTCDYLNSAVNFFVYYKYNSRFRKLCFAPKNERR